MRADEVRINVDRNDFMWTDSDKVTKYFFELLNDREKLFNENSLKQMAKFYVEDVEKIYEAKVMVSKNNNPMKKGELIDANISMFVEGNTSCHRLSFFLKDYTCNKMSMASKKLIKEKAEITKFALVRSFSRAS